LGVLMLGGGFLICCFLLLKRRIRGMGRVVDRVMVVGIRVGIMVGLVRGAEGRR
jgi:hypothetical protein